MSFNQDKKEKIEKVLKEIEEKNIKFCLLQFLSIEGTLKSIGINSNRIEEVLYSGEGFDGSSITGYGRLEESDMVAVPDPDTFAIIPWEEEGKRDAQFICDIYNPDETRFEGDPRYILQRIVDKAKDMGYQMMAAPELEFFVLKKGDEHDTPQATDYRGYFSADPANEDHLIRREIALYAESFPFLTVETVHHEVARSQHEIDIRYQDTLKIADSCMMMKMIVKATAARHGYIATFMPKPWAGHNGSGMHVHQSLWDIKTGKNTFYDPEDPNKISELLRWFIGGQLKHAHSMTAILNSWPNSYKRLVPGFEAPTLIAWGFKNRSMLIRVPNFFEKESAARCEIRSPDPAGNIYLVLAALLNAGLDGITMKIDPPAPVEVNLFHISKAERQKMGVKELPESLGEALSHMRHSTFTRDMLGEIAYQAFSDSRKKENDLFLSQVSEWELSRYSESL
ncbi:MAG: glutamine synthetase family protein [Promethearchaeota archaeon]